MSGSVWMNDQPSKGDRKCRSVEFRSTAIAMGLAVLGATTSFSEELTKEEAMEKAEKIINKTNLHIEKTCMPNCNGGGGGGLPIDPAPIIHPMQEPLPDLPDAPPRCELIEGPEDGGGVKCKVLEF